MIQKAVKNVTDFSLVLLYARAYMKRCSVSCFTSVTTVADGIASCFTSASLALGRGVMTRREKRLIAIDVRALS